ncbi:MAG: hypothetical protein HQK77_18290 [Desulfobacterales bacterium]|nr:hypothetical protein [Desulfobacterales bacterium]
MNDIEHFKQLRRCIMVTLYTFFQEVPYASIELSTLTDKCAVDYKELNWNLAYLEKCGYVELGKSVDAPPFIAASATISAKGIDLVENQEEFETKFQVLRLKGTS